MENREIARLLYETADLMEIAAEDAFRKVSELRGVPDGPSAFYLKEIGQQRTKPINDSVGDGIIRFESK